MEQTEGPAFKVGTRWFYLMPCQGCGVMDACTSFDEEHADWLCQTCMQNSEWYEEQDILKQEYVMVQYSHARSMLPQIEAQIRAEIEAKRYMAERTAVYKQVDAWLTPQMSPQFWEALAQV